MKPLFSTNTKTLAVIISSVLLLSTIGSVLGTAAFAETVVTYVNTPSGVASFIAVNPSTNKVYVATGSNSVTVIDGSTNKVTSTISIPTGSGAIAVNPNTNKIYVASTQSSDTLTVIDGSTNTVAATITLNSSSSVWAGAVAVNPATNKAYVDNANFRTGATSISIIDGSTNSVTGSISPAGSCTLSGMAINPVTNMLYGVDCSTIDVWNLNTNSLAATIQINNVGPWGVDLNPNTNTVYVGERGFDVEQYVVVIDGSTNKIVTQIDTGIDPAEVSVNPNTNKIYTSTGNSPDDMVTIDGSSNTIASRTPLNEYGAFRGVAVNPSSNIVYVAGADPNNSNSGLVAVVNAGSSSSSGTTSQLTVNSQDTSNNPLYGYYTVLYQNGAVQNTGFTPATFTLNNNQQYTVEVQDYGQYTFDYWADTGSTNRDRSISISSDTQIMAVYRNVNQPPPTPPPCSTCNQQSSVTVQSLDSNNNPISGYYTVLYQNGAVQNTGFTPATFSTTAGQTYTVEVQDYGGYYFNHWSDGTTNRDKTFTATSSGQTFTAVYSTSPSTNNNGGGGGTVVSGGSSSSISVTTTDSAGNQITGYYTTLWQNSQQIQSGFSPASFTVSNSQTYQVAVADYGNYVFDHWSDGTTNRFHTVTTGTGTTTQLTAVYR